MKTCYKCKQTKEFSYFAKDRSRKDDYNNLCKDCRRSNDRDKISRRNKNYYKKNQETITQRKREHYQTDENQERRQKYKEKNVDKIAE